MSPFVCQKCGFDGPTFYGVCVKCDPVLFREKAAAEARWNFLFAKFKEATGKEPLEDWYGFERFVEAI